MEWNEWNELNDDTADAVAVDGKEDDGSKKKILFFERYTI